MATESLDNGGAGDSAPSPVEAERTRTLSALKKRASILDGPEFMTDVFQQGVWKATYDHFYRRSWFWIVTTSLILMEPVLCSYNPNEQRTVYWLQVAVLAFSSACFVAQLIGHVAYEHIVKKCQDQDNTAESNNLDKINALRELIFTGAFVLEFFCILCGWVFIFWRPGIAALRCFRVFRILYYHELPSSGNPNEKGVLEAVKTALNRVLYFVGGETTTELVLKVCKFASYCLQNMAQEMFFLTDKTRGGFILMVMLFYSAYVVGCAMWVETTFIIAAPSELCLTLGGCVFTLLRLTFYDGNGLDFLWSLSKDNKFLFAIVVVYLCSTAFGILNGLIGIFGDIFNDNSDSIFVQEGTRDEDIKRMNMEISELLQDFRTINQKLDGLTERVDRLG